MEKTNNLRIRKVTAVDSAEQISQEYPVTEEATTTTAATRQAIHHILQGNDDRLLVVVGPCSIDDPKAALEYAQKLKILKTELNDTLVIVMRVYFEKPRTRLGWKGLINDPNIDGSYEINTGLRIARQLVLDLNNMGIPAGSEFLDIVTGQYISDLISWGAIGARTTESQIHRELASGLSCPVGFKNGTNGSLKVAIDAVYAAGEPHIFLSPTKKGRTAIFSTTGNRDAHIILRGGSKPNYDAEHIAKATETMHEAGLPPRFMIDLSHANSQGHAERQLIVGHDVAKQISQGNKTIIGVMIESHLLAGKQSIVAGQTRTYGQSITDACISWEQTMPLLRELANAMDERRK